MDDGLVMMVVSVEGHNSPEREEIADFLLRGLSGDVLDADGSRHDVC